MFSFRTTSLLNQEDLVLRKGNLAIFCNQTSWDINNGEYLYETLAKRKNLKRIFTPDSNLLSETPQTKSIEKILLNKNADSFLKSNTQLLTDIDALIVDFQDNGFRYSTNLSIIYSIFKILKDNNIDLPIYIIDKKNPNGRVVEGTMLRAGYRSNLGIEGLVHKHGLTIGEILYYIYNEINAKFPLHIISYKTSANNNELLPWSIPISDNFAGLFTSNFYCGQKLWEATNMSCGIGTSRPYEVFGSPYISKLFMGNDWEEIKKEVSDENVFMRETSFTPMFDKFKGERCFGFQILLRPNMQYHSLAHNLKIMQVLLKYCNDFQFYTEKNKENDKTAFECMVGDKDLLNFVTGKENWANIKDHIKVEEQKWIRKAKKALLYQEEQLYRIK